MSDNGFFTSICGHGECEKEATHRKYGMARCDDHQADLDPANWPENQPNLADVVKAVMERLYALDEEYEFLMANGDTGMFWTEDRGEHFHGVLLEGDRFLICNTLIEFLGSPRSVCGMVAAHKDRVMDQAESIKLFVAAGQAAVDYARRNMKPAKGKRKKKG